MRNRTISLPPHLDKWLSDKPEGASEWIRSQIEQAAKLENDLGGSEEAARAKLEYAQRELGVIAEKKAKDAEMAHIAGLEEQKKQDFAITRNELDNLKVLWRTEYNEIYARFRTELPGFNPLHQHKDAKILLDALKERIAEMEEARKKEVDKDGTGTSEAEPGPRA